MKLKKGKKIVELAHEAQISAYLKAGYLEVKETKKDAENASSNPNATGDDQK